MRYVYGKHLICSTDLKLFIHFIEEDTHKYMLLDENDTVLEHEDKIPIKVSKVNKDKFEVYNAKTDEIINGTHVSTKLLNKGVFAPGIRLRKIYKDQEALYEPMPCTIEAQIPSISNVGKLICRNWSAEDIIPTFDSDGDIEFPTAVMNTYIKGITAVNANHTKTLLENVRSPFQRLMNINNIDNSTKEYFGYVYDKPLSNIEKSYGRNYNYVKLTTDGNRHSLYVSQALRNYLMLMNEENLNELRNNFLPALLTERGVITKDNNQNISNEFRYIIVTSFGVIFAFGDDVMIYNRLYNDLITSLDESLIGVSLSNTLHLCNDFYIQDILYPQESLVQYECGLPVAYIKSDEDKVVSLYINKTDANTLNITKTPLYSSEGEEYNLVTDNKVRGKLLPLVEAERETLKILAQKSLGLNYKKAKSISFPELQKLYAEKKAVVVVNKGNLSIIKNVQFVINSDRLSLEDIKSTVSLENVVGFRLTNEVKPLTPVNYIHLSEKKVLSGGELDLTQRLLLTRFFDSHAIRLKVIDRDKLQDEFNYALKLAGIVMENVDASTTTILCAFRFNAKSSDLYIKYKLSKKTIINTVLIISIDSEYSMVVFDENNQPIDYLSIPTEAKKTQTRREKRFLGSIAKLRENDAKINTGSPERVVPTNEDLSDDKWPRLSAVGR